MVGRVTLARTMRVNEMAVKLPVLCGLREGSPVDVYEEIKFDPTVMVELLKPE